MKLVFLLLVVFNVGAEAGVLDFCARFASALISPPTDEAIAEATGKPKAFVDADLRYESKYDDADAFMPGLTLFYVASGMDAFAHFPNQLTQIGLGAGSSSFTYLLSRMYLPREWAYPVSAMSSLGLVTLAQGGRFLLSPETANVGDAALGILGAIAPYAYLRVKNAWNRARILDPDY